jgi:hypothetical protein
MDEQTPDQTHSAEYNRGWADGQASALDACQPIIDGLQAALAARSEPGAEGLTVTYCGRCNHPMHWHECGRDENLTAGPCRCRNDGEVAATPAADSQLDVERLGFTDLLDIGSALLAHYPPDTIVCSHSVKADIGAQTAAGIADVIASCRAALTDPDPAS